MVTLKFPSLNKALIKNQKDLKENDPRKGIIVLDGNAIVLRNDFCFVVNLYDYFTLECGIEDDDEITELNRILFFMNGKVFNNEFWNELTKGSNTKMNQGSLYIENPKYSKDLHHKEIIVDMLEPLISLRKAISRDEAPVPSIGLPFLTLKTIYDCMSNDFKTDILLMEFSAQDQPVKFTFRARKHCFGFINPHYDSTQEGFRFEAYKNFIHSENTLDLISELELEFVPPPPPSGDVATEEYVPYNQLKLVEDE